MCYQTLLWHGVQVAEDVSAHVQQQELQRCKRLAASGKSSSAGEKLYIEMILGGEDQDSAACLSPAQQAALSRCTLCLFAFVVMMLVDLDPYMRCVQGSLGTAQASLCFPLFFLQDEHMQVVHELDGTVCWSHYCDNLQHA